MGVRGLGDKQWKARMMTYSKIVSFLTVSPFTFEQLWKVSRIHRNTLKKRLDYLVSERTILKHKYSVPNRQEFYGYIYKYPIPNPYVVLLYGHTYYLLNCSDASSRAFSNFYYNNMAKKQMHLTNELSIREPEKSRRKLDIFEDKIEELEKEMERYDYRKKELSEKGMTMSDKEFHEFWRKKIELLILHARSRRNLELLAVKEGYRLPYGSEDVTEEQRDKLIKVADFFTKRGYSLLDVLIRCSTENTIISPTSYINDVLIFVCIPYNVLWKVMDEVGVFKNLNLLR